MSYDPALGRFLERDPIGYDDGMNPYEFVRSNPLHYLDPLGLAADDHTADTHRTVAEQLKAIRTLIEQLDNDAWKVRNDAHCRLVENNPHDLDLDALLRQALRDKLREPNPTDREVEQRLIVILQQRAARKASEVFFVQSRLDEIKSLTADPELDPCTREGLEQEAAALRARLRSEKDAELKKALDDIKKGKVVAP